MTYTRRVVITGVGLVTPLGTGVEKNWQALMDGRSGIGPVTRFDVSDFPTRIAGEVKDFHPEEFIEKKEIKKMDLFIQYAVAAAKMAMDEARLPITVENEDMVGVIVGVGIAGLSSIEEYHKVFLESRLKKVSPFFIPKLIANLAPGQISIRYGAKGINYTPTSACSSGAHAIGEAFRLIRLGEQDAMIAGGAEAALTPLGLGGFIAMKAVSSRNDPPEKASRPFDRNRDGFVMSEGAGVLVLEELEQARSRGAKIYAEVIGYGANSDAYHITAPSPEGEGAVRCLRLALRSGGIDPLEVDYVNAHGTSTPYNDATETHAIKRVFGEHAARMAVSSTKSMTGHLLGAAGGVEAVYSALALHHQCLPPTINYEEPDPECDLDYVPNVPRRAPIRVALSNSFGFGGTNVCLAFRRWTE
ncbi:MAG TPA: beta-ketoacyl-ACP synthase II [Candidatus Binatia bacterium]|jgi:3-oxoacyl-[acyl-carrier-protein] synthase II|nr:beta-ketoacyl-ACP synthase II [Candidatus Binatia bacterium]